MEKKRLTKKALNDFISWSSSRYNSYFMLGNKKTNVELVYNSLLHGHRIVSEDIIMSKFTIECAGAVGENGNGRYWRTRGKRGKSKDYSWEIDCVEKTVTGLQSGEKLQFI